MKSLPNEANERDLSAIFQGSKRSRLMRPSHLTTAHPKTVFVKILTLRELEFNGFIRFDVNDQNFFDSR
jgi:hypothetical protein